MLALDGAEATNSRGDEDADVMSEGNVALQTRITEGEFRRRHCVMDEDVHLLDVLGEVRLVLEAHHVICHLDHEAALAVVILCAVPHLHWVLEIKPLSRLLKLLQLGQLSLLLLNKATTNIMAFTFRYFWFNILEKKKLHPER